MANMSMIHKLASNNVYVDGVNKKLCVVEYEGNKVKRLYPLKEETSHTMWVEHPIFLKTTNDGDVEIESY